MSEEQAKTPPDSLSEKDENVTARWSVAVIPKENVSIHYEVSPNKEEDAVTSVTTSFALMKDHRVQHTFGGSTIQELINPKAGQGSIGDSGVDSTVFPEKPDGDLVAILSGTVRTGETTANFFFQKPFDPAI